MKNSFSIMTTIRSILKKLLAVIDRMRFKNLNFAVVSNNCWGGEVYKMYSKEFNTPFIGLFIMPYHYVKLIENLNFYLNKKLEFIVNDNFDYPIGRLGDIEIHFMHYKSRNEVVEKWERRKTRFLEFSNTYPHKVFFKMCDRDGASEALILRFHHTPYLNKISFSNRALEPKIKNHIPISETDGNTIPDGKKLFYISLKYFDLHKWLRKGQLKTY